MFPYLVLILLAWQAGWLGPLSRDGDLYYHLRIGESILSSHSIPWFDSLTYTFAGHPNELHSWLGSTLLALFFKCGGEVGLRFLHSLIVFGVLFSGLCFLRRRGNSLALVWAASLYYVMGAADDLRPSLFLALS